MENDRTVEREIYEMLEWYICDCISYGPNHVGGWWCDGVITLKINNPIGNQFKLLGVTWIGCDGIAPFEIDVELDTTDDAYFANTVFRIGMTDDRRAPQICDRNLAADRVLDMRPRYNRDWALAMELTPPTET